MLLHIMRQTYVIVVIGIVFLVVFVGLNIASNNSMKEQAMEAVQSGDIQTAESLVFGEEYEQTAQVQTMVQMMDQFEI